jgi:hypothetical protein
VLVPAAGLLGDLLELDVAQREPLGRLDSANASFSLAYTGSGPFSCTRCAMSAIASAASLSA